MSRRLLAVVALAAVMAAGVGGVWLTRPELLRIGASMEPPAAPMSDTRALYYRDPDGKPSYSPTPVRTNDGRAYVAVAPNEEKLSFETGAKQLVAERTIKFYRNPMGLPDYSPVPKKDSMGMDYIPVYEDDSGEDGSAV